MRLTCETPGLIVTIEAEAPYSQLARDVARAVLMLLYPDDKPLSPVEPDTETEEKIPPI